MFLGLIIALEIFLAVFPRLVGICLVLPLHELDFVEDVCVVYLLDGFGYFLGILLFYSHSFLFYLLFFKLHEIDGDVLLG